MSTEISTSDPRRLLEITDLRIAFDDGSRQRDIVIGADFRVNRGETIGIVGESGSGKSLCARAIIGLLPRNIRMSGSVKLTGRELANLPERAFSGLRGTRLAMLFQDPYTMLNPLLRNGLHIEETLNAQGTRLKRSERVSEIARRLEEVGIEDPIVAQRFPYELSGGMRQRVALAATLARDPELLIADEPTTALDVMTQAEILRLLRSIQERRGMGMILITHDLRVAFSVCDRVYVMYAGRILEVARSSDIEREPLHPYSLSLLLSEPPIDKRQAQLMSVRGNVPEPAEVEGMCAFAPRCSWANPVCRSQAPPLADLGGSHLSACLRIRAIRDIMRSTRSAAEVPEEPATKTRPNVGTSVAGGALVETRDLKKTFTLEHGKQVDALRGVTIRIDPGESVGLVGASGSGKTTLGRLLIGLETPTSGQVSVEGLDCTNIAAMSSRDRSQLRRTVQMVFQDPYSSLDPAQTVGAALREVLRVHNHPKDLLGERVTELLELVELPPNYASRVPPALSGGERQRVAIARALAVGRPKCLVCDEPVSALDVSVQAQILTLFRSLKDQIGLSYLFITHDLAVVRQLVTRIYVLYRGEVVEEGLVDDVLDFPQHPYTKQLIASIPTGSSESRRRSREPEQMPLAPLSEIARETL